MHPTPEMEPTHEVGGDAGRACSRSAARSLGDGRQVAHLDALSGVSLGLAGTLVGNPTPSFLTLVAADAVVSVSSGVLAIALVFRGDPNRGARGLAVTLAAWSYLLAYSGIVVLLRPDPGALRTIFQAHFPLVELLGLAGMIRFTSIFPHKLTKRNSPPESRSQSVCARFRLRAATC